MEATAAVENDSPPDPALSPLTDEAGALNAPCLDIPLPPIIDRLPPKLRAKVQRPTAPSDVVRLPLATALEQLPRGAVRIRFRELRLRAATGVFAHDSALDEALVDLPLAEVLPRITPALLARRPGQKQISVPDQVPSVFQSRRGGGASNGSVTKPAEVTTGNDDAASSRLIAATAPEAPVPPPVPPVPAPVVANPHAAVNGEKARPTPAAPSEVGPRVSPSSEGGSETVQVPMAPIAANWPEPLRSAVVSQHGRDSVKIPLAQLEAALKQGRAVFTWRQLRTWACPKPLSICAEQDAVSLELPLSVLAPLFLARRSKAATAKKLDANGEIPDLFPARKPQNGEAAATPPAQSPPAEQPPSAPQAELEQSIFRPRPSQPAAAPAAVKATAGPAAAGVLPADLVRRACQLSGVTGALLATADGLVIANQLPPGINSEAVAGFLPRLCSRLGEYTRELKLSDPTEVDMLAGNIPLQVYKLNGAFFAVLGKASETLPKTQLRVLAGQLSHRTQ